MKLFGAVAIVSLLLVGCSGSGSQDKDAIRQGVIEHLTGKTGLDVGSMDVEVTSVTFDGDTADATVSFKPKGSDNPAALMQMQYKLERKGSHWVVTGKSGDAGSPHGGGMGAPPAGGGQNPHGAAPPSGEMPSGHPPVTGEKPKGSTDES